MTNKVRSLMEIVRELHSKQYESHFGEKTEMDFNSTLSIIADQEDFGLIECPIDNKKASIKLTPKGEKWFMILRELLPKYFEE